MSARAERQSEVLQLAVQARAAVDVACTALRELTSALRAQTKEEPDGDQRHR